MGKGDRKRGGPVWAKAEEVREERTYRIKMKCTKPDTREVCRTQIHLPNLALRARGMATPAHLSYQTIPGDPIYDSRWPPRKTPG